MKLELLEEHEDGSATFQIETTKKETEMLVEYAVLNLLNDFIEKEEEKCEDKE